MTEPKSYKKVRGDFFNAGALAIFAALSGRAVEEEAQSLLDEEERLANEIKK